MGMHFQFNRPSQAMFKCVVCEHADQAGINADRNILASGIGHLHGKGRRWILR
ncbi:MAG: hypothetical protein OXE41_01805 [Gammaproteobacteria bacterium]|nr:hypothetical protein [Gammaproteobacteria bacterium]